MTDTVLFLVISGLTGMIGLTLGMILMSLKKS